MSQFRPFLRSIALAVALQLIAAPVSNDVLAHEGHDHEEAEVAAPGIPGGGARSVTELSSESFEALIESHGDHLDIWLDRYETNEPVAGATLTLTLGEGAELTPAEESPGQYTVDIAPLAPGNTVPVTLVVSVGDESDLLGGTLEMAAAVEAPLGSQLGGWISASWRWALGLAVLALAAAFVRHRRRAGGARFGNAVGAALAGACALLAATALVTGGTPAAAHEGHDHEGEAEAAAAPAAPGGGRPMRLADGSVFVPKPTQRILELRTQPVREGATSVSSRLAGEIVGDPRASATLQTLQGGRVAGADGRWPVLGARVRRGEVLLRLTPSGSGSERAAGAAEAARVGADLSQAEAELARLEGLPGVVSRAEVEAARSRVASLHAQRVALTGSVGAGGEALASPIDGVIASIDARPGAVVAPGEALVGLIDPARLSIEALAFEPVVAGAITRASVVLRDGRTLEAKVEGVGAQLKGGAVPVRLNLATVAPGLSVGQPVVVFLERVLMTPGMALPAAAVVRLPSGERVVFEKVSAERFVPRTVRLRQVSAEQVAVLSGLEADARIVVRGAALVAQIR